MATSAAYFRVSPKLWQHAKRARWSQDATMLAVYLLTCRHRNTEGLYELPLGYAAADLGYRDDELQAALDELVGDGFVEHDPGTELVFLPKALVYQSPSGGDQVTGAVNRLLELPDSPLLARFAQVCEDLCPALWTELPDEWKHIPAADDRKSETNHHAPPQASPSAETPAVDRAVTGRSTAPGPGGHRAVSDRSSSQSHTQAHTQAQDSKPRGSPPRGGGDLVAVSELLPDPPAPPKRSRAPAKQRPRDPVWDASCECEPVTNDAERKARNEACRLMRQSLDGAGVADDYGTRHAAVLELWNRYPDAMPPGNRRTFNAVARNVGKVLNHASGRNTTRPPENVGYGVVG